MHHSCMEIGQRNGESGSAADSYGIYCFSHPMAFLSLVDFKRAEIGSTITQVKGDHDYLRVDVGSMRAKRALKVIARSDEMELKPESE